MVLDDLVLDEAHLGLLDGKLREGDASLVCGHGRGVEDPVNLLLAERGELNLRGAHRGDSLREGVDAVNDFLGLCHASSIPVDSNVDDAVPRDV